MEGLSMKISAVLGALAGFLILASAAIASGSSSVGGYGGSAGEVASGLAGGNLGSGAGGSVAGTSVASTGRLPFTGVDLLYTALVGVAILLLGLALRRAGRART
jgi:hypothetical protein